MIGVINGPKATSSWIGLATISCSDRPFVALFADARGGNPPPARTSSSEPRDGLFGISSAINSCLIMVVSWRFMGSTDVATEVDREPEVEVVEGV